MNNKFIELLPFKHGEHKQPILINVNNIQTVIKDDDYFSKVVVSDSIKDQLEECITADSFMYVVYPNYEGIASSLTEQSIGEINNGRTN